jgi:hypothetical protein
MKSDFRALAPAASSAAWLAKRLSSVLGGVRM